MVKRSLKISEQYREQVRNALIDIGLTQKNLSIRVQLSRSTVSNFFNSKPIYKENFVEICKLLKLDWQEITGLKAETEENNNSNNLESNEISALVTKLRKHVEPDIENRCGTMRIFDMTQPMGLGEIYTQVNILEKIIGQLRKEIEDLMQICNLAEFSRFNFGEVKEEKIAGTEAVKKYQKLLVLGKPGAGKTTFLKHLAIQSIQNKFQEDLVPFFVTLKDFAETTDKPSLFSYLANYLDSRDQENFQQILNQGKALILLDGLDEVLAVDSQRVIKEIINFSNKFLNNQYLLTCRIAAKQYTFEKFTEVEIADFDKKQIKTFAANWFKNKVIKAETFIEDLEKDKPIEELAKNPLLLTLLCLAYQELGYFPPNRAGLYKEGLDALLTKWDSKRGIRRDQVYKKLWLERKKDLLSKIAWDTFSPGEYFFKQEKVEKYICQYIRNLPGANTDEEALRLDSDVVLRSIESQHGLLVARAKKIYSFSHLTFQEYFTAREIIQVRQSQDLALQELVQHIFDSRWREVFFLAVGMSPNGNKLVLLMKETIDNSLAKDEKIQRFLQWLNEKTIAVDITFNSQDITRIQNTSSFFLNLNLSISRALYLSLGLGLYFSYYLYPDLELYLNFEFYLHRIIDISCAFSLDFNSYCAVERHLKLSLEQAQKNAPELYQQLQKLKGKLSNWEEKEIFNKTFNKWWQSNGKTWEEDLRKIMIEHRNIGHDWQFDQRQKELLEQYYRANQLLTQCLQRECYVSVEVRQYIEETILLPITEIEKYGNPQISKI
ncbi:MAG: NACHT domain-containing NTPase [Cyanobacteria bacterium P01_F01_bin.143]